MTNEKAIFIINNRLNTYYCTDEDIEALNKAVESLKNEDNIVKSYGSGYEQGHKEGYDKGYDDAISLKRSQCEWIDNGQGFHFCKSCGYFALYQTKDSKNYFEKLSNYCPNCGKEMKGGKIDEDIS